MRRAAAVLSLCCFGAAVFSSCAPLRRLLPEEPLPPPVVVPAPPLEEKPPAPPPPAPPPAPRYRERESRAHDLLRRDELARALTEWKILQALDPNNPEYPRQITATRALIRHRVEKHLQAGDEAFSSGDREQAQLEYLKALALDPRVTEPLGRLREIERDRTLAVQAERSAKLKARRGGGKKSAAGATNGAAPGQQERDYLETGIALFKQGKYEESILEIQKYLQSFPDDADALRYVGQARRKLAPPSASPRAGPAPAPRAPGAASPAPPPEGGTSAEDRKAAEKDPGLAQESYEKGLRASRTDIARAIEYWEQALRYDPDHVQARLQLERAWRMQRTLEQIPGE